MYVGTSSWVARQPGDNRPLADLYKEYVERAIMTEELGYDFLWQAEHHFMETQWNPSPLVVLAGIATRTTRLRLGTNVLLTPFYNPLRLAEDVATLDLLSNGRMDLICGSASISGEFETYGVKPEERFGRVWETMAIIRRAFSEERFDHRGKYFTFPNIRMTTRPVQQPFPLWFGGFGPRMFARAGREGYPVYGGGSATWQIYEEELQKHGHNPDALNRGVGGGPILLAASERDLPAMRERAEREADAHAAEYNEQGRDLAFQTIPSRRATPVVGTPVQVLAHLEPTLKNSRATHFHITTADTEQLRLFAREVLPTLKTWGREPVYHRAAAS